MEHGESNMKGIYSRTFTVQDDKLNDAMEICKGLAEEQCNLQSNCQYIKGTTKRRGYCRRRATPTAKRNTTKKKS